MIILILEAREKSKISSNPAALKGRQLVVLVLSEMKPCQRTALEFLPPKSDTMHDISPSASCNPPHRHLFPGSKFTVHANFGINSAKCKGYRLRGTKLRECLQLTLANPVGLLQIWLRRLDFQVAIRPEGITIIKCTVRHAHIMQHHHRSGSTQSHDI